MEFRKRGIDSINNTYNGYVNNRLKHVFWPIIYVYKLDYDK